MIAAAVDTNVLASGFVSSEASPGQIIDAWLDEQFELVVSEHILSELRRTFNKPYFVQRVTGERVQRILALLRRRARVTPITATVQGVATHPEDDLVIATAVSAGASDLVTGDRLLRSRGSYQGVTFVSPREFLDTVLNRAID